MLMSFRSRRLPPLMCLESVQALIQLIYEFGVHLIRLPHQVAERIEIVMDTAARWCSFAAAGKLMKLARRPSF